MAKMGSDKQTKRLEPTGFVGECGSGMPSNAPREETAAPTLFGQARRTRDTMNESLNNLEFLLGRLRQQPNGDCGEPKKTAPDSLEDVLADCNYLARRLVSVSQELSGIIGE